jgi:hypothetical protein
VARTLCCVNLGLAIQIVCLFFFFNACFSHLSGEAYARYNGKVAHGFVIRPPEIIHVVQSLKAIFSDSTEASLLVNIIWCHCDSM